MSQGVRVPLPLEPGGHAPAAWLAEEAGRGMQLAQINLARAAPVRTGNAFSRYYAQLEDEAERAARQVTRIPEPNMTLAVAERVADPAGTGVVATSAGGRAMGAGERAYFEPRFGHSFGNVRIHTSERAAVTARLLGAQAFTRGNDIAFARDQYRPWTDGGRRLIAHELAHVIQQGQAAPLADRLPRPFELSTIHGGRPVQRRALTPATVAGLNLGPLAVMPPEYIEPFDEPPGAQSLRIAHAVGTLHALTATSEAVPADDRAGVFAGFTALHDAQSFAVHQPAITMIVSDQDPRLHVLNVSGAPSTSNPVRSYRLNPDLGFGLSVSRVVNPHQRGVATRDPSWPAREAHARWLRRQYLTGPHAGDAALWAQLRRTYTVLAVDACGATPDQIYVLQNVGDSPRPGLININIFSAGTSAGSGLSGPGRLDPDMPPAQQQQWFLINWRRFQEGEHAVRSTYRHESIHAGSRERALILIEHWRRLRRPQGSLLPWLEAQRLLPHGGLLGISDRDVLLAQVYLRGNQSDEPFTAAMTFMTVFHTTTADEIDPATAFSQLNYMLSCWARIADLPHLRQHILDSLQRYYQQRLDPAHRAAFDAWVDQRTSTGSGPGSRERADALRQMRAFRGSA